MAAKKCATSKRPGGPTQPEGDRKRPLFAARLNPRVASEIYERAELAGVSVGAVVELAWAIACDEGRLDGALLLAAALGKPAVILESAPAEHFAGPSKRKLT